jgi:hypothetical protein
VHLGKTLRVSESNGRPNGLLLLLTCQVVIEPGPRSRGSLLAEVSGRPTLAVAIDTFDALEFEVR